MSQVWFITGGANGLGASIAKAALAAGNRVVVSDLDTARLGELYESYGTDALTVKLDIRHPEQAESAVAAALTHFGRIDVLVNNAGYGQFGPFETIAPEAIERQFATNVFGTLNVTRAVLPVLRRQRAGHVINMSSNGGFKGVSGASMYSASKFAIEGFSESLAEEVAAFGVKVTIVEPGAFRTNFLDSQVLRYGDLPIDDYAAFWSGAKAVFEKRNHQQRGDPDKLATALVRLAEDSSPPLRFVAGADALHVVEAKLAAVADDIAAWRDLTLSTDF
ncbi:SDR family NAD(P)-dependent oxidoreductase [Burkholderia sp. Bp9031]|uniref:SDR family NAD(P)-dependent oxidoreductase n=1 Tax=Burkholderia sp. Bp9031 TaxID=2184566 RepID=UPI0007164C32|nr:MULTISPECIES: SDR family NAD(P)-dependent oxidoreductase [Burkholderia]RQZ17114.1 SDR family NAD(P)-dependent oxidoreductase [Burkholderia sp. Bp9031]